MTLISWALGFRNKRRKDTGKPILIGKMPGLRGAKKRRINTSALSWTEVTPSGDMVPSAAPSSVSDFGDTHTILDSLRTDPVPITLVGADTDRNYNATVYMGATSGWKFNPRNYRLSKLFANTLTLYNGDNLSTVDQTSTPPSYVVGGTYTDLSQNIDRNYDTSVTTVAKTQSTPYSSLKVSGAFSNLSTHFCFPVGLGKAYGSQATGARYSPYGWFDLFSSFTGFSGSEYQVLQMSLGTGPADSGTDIPLVGPLQHAAAASKDYGIYTSIEQTFIIHNPGDTSIELDLYYLSPRKDTINSPLFDYCWSYQYGNDSITSNNASSNPFTVNRPLFRDKPFRDRWRCIKKKVYKLSGLATLKVKCRVPLSLVKYNTLVQAQMGNGNVSLSGLTGWLYVVARGLYGLDTQSVANSSNSSALGFGIPRYVISSEQRITVLWQRKHQSPYMDQRVNYTESDTIHQVQENDENNNVND